MAILAVAAESVRAEEMPAVRHLYVAQKGISLSRVAQCLVGTPVYTKDSGSLKRLLAENPRLSQKYPIPRGTRVVLPESSRDYEPHASLHCERDFAGARETLRNLRVQREPVYRRIAATPPAAALPGATLPASTLPAGPIQQSVLKTEGSRPTDGRYGGTSFGAQAFYFAIKGLASNGSQTVLLSDSALGLEGRWRQHWSPHWTSHIDFAATRVTFLSIDSKTFTQVPLIATQIKLGSTYDFGLFKTGVSLGTGHQIFFSTPSASEIFIEKVQIPEASATLGVRLIDLAPFQAHIETTATRLLAATTSSFSIYSGTSYSGGLHLRDDRKEVVIFYQSTFQNTSNITQTRSDLGIRLRIHLGDGK